MNIPGSWSRWRERRQRLSSRCVVCGTAVTEWLRVGIDREYGRPHGEVEVLDCDDLLHLCVLCATALEEDIRDAITQTVTTHLHARGLALGADAPALQRLWASDSTQTLARVSA